MIEVRSLIKEFEDVVAVNDVNFTVNKGEVTGILGPQSAGKSTILKLLATLLEPSSGRIYYDGLLPKDIKNDIGYLSETNPLYQEMMVYDHLKYIAALRGIKKNSLKERVMQVSYKCGILEILAQTINTLPIADRQRVGLASAIINDPKIIILDQPAIGFDQNQLIDFKTLLKELSADRVIILSSHIMQEIQTLCQRIIVVNEGKIVYDGANDVHNTILKRKNIIHFVLDKFLHPDIILDINENIEYVDHKQIRGVHKLSFEYPTEYDFCEEIFERVNKYGLKLLEIYKETHHLEDVFKLLK